MSIQYREKFKDPRWQKKRLDIMSRDNFTCQICGETERTLNVHHRIYERGREPWEYNNDLLVTLCQPCHETETERWSELPAELIIAIKKKFNATDVVDLLIGFEEIVLQDTSENVAVALSYAMRDKDTQSCILKKFHDEFDRKK